MSRREEVIAAFSLEGDLRDDDTVKGPGKFEGLPLFALHYWDAYMNGDTGDEEFEDLNGVDTSAWEITADDAAEFEDLKGDVGRWIAMWESDQGFVHYEIVSRDELEEAMAEAEEGEEDEGGE